MARTSGWSSSASTTAFPPFTRFTTPLGSSILFEQLEDAHHRERHALRRLQYERVAGGNRVGQEPERNHRRKIERRDRRDHAERLADHHFVDAARHVFEVVALHQVGIPQATSTFSMARRSSALRSAKRLSVFHRDDAGQLVHMLFEQHFQLEERLDAIFRRRRPPPRKGLAGCGNCGIHLPAASEAGTESQQLLCRLDSRPLGARRFADVFTLHRRCSCLDGVYLSCTQGTHNFLSNVHDEQLRLGHFPIA